MQACYDNLKLEIQILENKKKKISEDLIAVEEDLEIKTLILNGEFDGGLEDVAVDNNNDSAPVANDVPVNAKPPPFSFLLDPMKFNCRTVPKSTINRILATDYKNRKELQDAKMQSIASEVWKIDFHYKIAPRCMLAKERVFHHADGVGVNVQNEDALAIFWKFYPGLESLDVMREDLLALDRRNKRLRTTTKVAYVDNCCNVSNKMQEIVPGILAKLDVFHWQKRWDVILYDLKGEKTTIFCALMRRAVFLVKVHECQRVAYMLAHKKPNQSADAA